MRAVLAAALLGLTGCEMTGGSLAPSAAIPLEAPRVTSEAAGDRDHDTLVAAFGGEVRAPAAQQLLAEITDQLVRATERPDERYRITVLDSPVVNAFALPSGRLYVTRGLLALANDTSEIAAVLAHEIAHVTLRHAAARGELEARSVLFSRIAAELLNDPHAGTSLKNEARTSIARFSRAQELEADQIGIRTLARAGFDPYGGSRFLTGLDRTGNLKAGAGDRSASSEMLATHPATSERIAIAIQSARRIGAPGIGAGERARYLAAVNGIAYGDNPKDGIVRGRRFAHPRLGIAFEAPDGIALENTPKAVLGSSADGGRRLLFDAVEVAAGQSLEDVLRSTWSDAIETGSIQSLTVNGAPAAIASSRSKDWIFRMAAARVGANTFRLIMAARSGDLDGPFRRTLDSLRPVDTDEARTLRPLRIEVVTAAPGDSAESLGRRMLVPDRPTERFLVLNGLDRASAVRPGEAYKLIVE